MPKKRKKKRKKPTPRQDSPEAIYFTEYEITWETIPDPVYQRLPKSVKAQLERLHADAQANPEQAIPKLLALKEKYPHVPQIYNYLTVAYYALGDREKAEAIADENIRRNPDYLFAKLNKAEFYLSSGEYEKIPELFDHKLELKLLYPHRKRFHISEVTGFFGLMGLYFVRIGEWDAAKTYADILGEIAPDAPITWRLLRELNPGLMTKVLQKLFSRDMGELGE